MKRMLWAFLVGLLLLAACGPSEPPIEKPAAEMNLGGEDLPAGFRQTEELELNEILERIHLSANDKGALKDANMRIFVLTPTITATAAPTAAAAISTTQVIAAVLRFDSEAAAQSGVGDVVVGFQDAYKSVPLAPEALATPSVGTAAQFLRVQVPEQKTQACLLAFAKRNVVGMVLVSGPAGQVEDLTRSLGQALDKGIVLPATPVPVK